MKKAVYIFFVTKAILTNKDNCDRTSAERNVKVCILNDCLMKKLSGVGFVRLDSGREPEVRFFRACHLALI